MEQRRWRQIIISKRLNFSCSLPKVFLQRQALLHCRRPYVDYLLSHRGSDSLSPSGDTSPPRRLYCCCFEQQFAQLQSACIRIVHSSSLTRDWCRVVALLSMSRSFDFQLKRFQFIPGTIEDFYHWIAIANKLWRLTWTRSPCSCPDAVNVKWHRNGNRVHCGGGTRNEYVLPISP